MLFDISISREKMTPRELYVSIKNLNHGSTDVDNMSLMLFILSEYQAKKDNHVADVFEFIELLDHMITNQYKEKSAILNSLANKKQEIDSVQNLDNIYRNLFHLFKIGQETMTHSAKFVPPISSSNSKSFQVVTGIYDKKIYTPDMKLVDVFPTDILNIGNNKDSLKFRLTFGAISGNYENYNLTAWIYSNMLFPKLESGFLASNVFSLFILNSDDDIQYITNAAETDYLEIEFPLRIVPTQDTINTGIKCLSFNYNDDSGSLNPKITSSAIESFKSNSLGTSVTCKFKGFAIDRQFYSVGYVGEQTNTASAIIYRIAMDETDNYNIAHYTSPGSSNVFKTFGSTLFLAVILLLSFSGY